MITKVEVFACLIFYVINTNLVGGKQNVSEGINATKNFVVGRGRENFFQAYVKCKYRGMDLASINSQQDEEDLTYFLNGVNKTGNEVGGFWLSATNLPDVDSAQYFWLTGGQRALYTNWLHGEPSGGEESCLQWVEVSGITGWNDYLCHEKIRYICQDQE